MKPSIPPAEDERNLSLFGERFFHFFHFSFCLRSSWVVFIFLIFFQRQHRRQVHLGSRVWCDVDDDDFHQHTEELCSKARNFISTDGRAKSTNKIFHRLRQATNGEEKKVYITFIPRLSLSLTQNYARPYTQYAPTPMTSKCLLLYSFLPYSAMTSLVSRCFSSSLRHHKTFFSSYFSNVKKRRNI